MECSVCFEERKRGMELEIFNKNEIEMIYSAMVENMTENQKKMFVEQYGSMEEWKKAFIEKASTQEAQENYAKVVEWYGSKEKALEASMNPQNEDIQLEYQKRMSAICQKLADNMDKNVDSAEIRSLIEEYDSLTKEMFQMSNASTMVLEIAKTYRENKEMQAAQDSIYGAGATEYMGKAMEAFYKRQ